MISIALVIAIWALGYALACLVWPLAACRKCEGVGRFRSPSKKYWRPCPRCDGSGRRIRTGRYVVEWFRFGGRGHD